VSIPTDAKHTPLDPPNASVPAVDPRTGNYTNPELMRQQKARNYVVGAGRIIPCSCSTPTSPADPNALTLTPNGSGGEDGEGPLLEGDYKFGDVFLFWADATSDGPVTATVVPKKGTLPTLKAYVDAGANQADSGDVVSGSVYMAVYAPHLDTNAGGFVLK
jgi:hypothetical protein